ncbi:MAG TPA: hypothetical protein VI588_04880, partial [Candidatus Gracilibacteria bacterium]|nr:hypothetical protein [Candidatus Gracilibacteria bacterium]
MFTAFSLTLNRMSLRSVFLGAALLAIVAFSTQQAHASGGACFDISGVGTEVPVSGVPNSGYLDFETLVPDYQYEACLEDPGTGFVGPFVVKGWA